MHAMICLTVTAQMDRPINSNIAQRRQKLGLRITCRSGVTRYMMLVPGRLQLAVLTAPHALPA